MKNKLRIYMLVASLFMCCGVIGFGIYAATLGVKIPGALGYNGASNVITVAMAVEDVAEYNGDTQIGKITKTFSESYVSASPTVKLGASISDLYFYNDGTKNKDMVFRVTVGNVSTSKRLVTLNAPSGLPANVTLSTASHFITFPLKTYMNAGESKMFMFGLTYSGTGKYQLISGSMGISTSTSSVSSYSTLFQYETNVGWYATMGTNPYSGYNEPLRWMPFAKKTTAGVAVTGDKTSTSLGTLSSEYQSVTYKGLSACPKINESYYLISEYVLEPKSAEETTTRGISYNFYEEISVTALYNDGNTWKTINGITPNDYSISNIRAYLTGSRTAYQSYTYDQTERTYTGKAGSELVKSFEEQFNVQNSALYNNIVARSQNNLYKELVIDASILDGTYVETSILGKSTNTVDKFWLISNYEYYTFEISSTVQNILGEKMNAMYLRWTNLFSFMEVQCGAAGIDAYAYERLGVRPAIQVALNG